MPAARDNATLRHTLHASNSARIHSSLDPWQSLGFIRRRAQHNTTHRLTRACMRQPGLIASQRVLVISTPGHGSWDFMSVPLVILGRRPCQHTPSPQAKSLHLHRATAPVSNGRSEHLTAVLVSASVPAPTVDQHCMCLERWARLHSESNAQGKASVPMAMALRYADSLIRRHVQQWRRACGLCGREHAGPTECCV